MKTFLISLPQDEARRKLLKGRFPQAWEAFEIVSAVDGRSMSAREYFQLAAPLYRSKGELLSPAEVGCALSHLEAYRQFLDTDEKMALILEDDIEGRDEDISRIARVAGQLDKDFLLCCGAQDWLRSRRWLFGKQRSSSEPGVFTVNGHSYRQMWRTACYVLSRGMAADLLARQSAVLHKADDWASLLKRSKGEVLFCDVLSHPAQHAGSSIEAERTFLMSQAFEGRNKPVEDYFNYLMDRFSLFRSIFLSMCGFLNGYRRIFRDF